MQGNWIASNWWQLTLAFVLIVGYVVIVANDVTATKELKLEFSKLREQFILHTSEQGLHRGPDFEMRMMNMEHQLESLHRLLSVTNDDIKQLLRSSKTT